MFLKNIYLLAVLGLCCCPWAFSSRPVRASHCAGFCCCRAQAAGCVGFGDCGARAWELWHMGPASSCMGDHPGPGIEPVSPTFLTTGWILNYWTTRDMDRLIMGGMHSKQNTSKFMLCEVVMCIIRKLSAGMKTEGGCMLSVAPGRGSPETQGDVCAGL